MFCITLRVNYVFLGIEVAYFVWAGVIGLVLTGHLANSADLATLPLPVLCCILYSTVSVLNYETYFLYNLVCKMQFSKIQIFLS